MMNLVSIEEVCSLVTDGTHYTPPDVGTGVPFLTVKDMDIKGLNFDNCSHITLEEYQKALTGNSAPLIGDVLFSKDGTVGKVHVVKENKKFAVLSSIAILRPKKELLNSKYFGYILRSPATLDQAIKRKTGSAIRRIILKDLKKVQIPLPPLEEQIRIAQILDKADEIRQKRKQAIQLTEELLKSTFLDMFGDPVINPKGWDVVEFKNIFKNIKYGTGSPPIFEDTGIPFIRATNIKNGTVLTNDLKFISEIEAKKIEKCKLKVGDILIVRSGVNSGDSALITEEYKDAYAGYDMIIDIDSFFGIFYNYLINSDSGKQIIKPLTRRAGQPHLNADQIKKLRFIFPPKEEINKFNIFFEFINKTKQKQLVFLQESENLFNSLLQRAFKGEL